MEYVVLISESSAGLRPEDIASAQARLSQQVDAALDQGWTAQGPLVCQPCGGVVVLLQPMLCHDGDDTEDEEPLD